jgi:hypothetical protein
MARTLVGALRQDANRRRERAERKKAEIPPRELAVHNTCCAILNELEPPIALRIVKRIERQITEFIAVQARSGW